MSGRRSRSRSGGAVGKPTRMNPLAWGASSPTPHHPCREPGLQGASAWGVGPGEDRQQREQDCLGPHLLRATESGALGTPMPPPHEYPPGVPKLAMPEIPQGTQ